MLLKIDVYPFHATEPSETRHVCLATCTPESSSITIGRLGQDLNINDKSVSRSHAELQFVSSRENQMRAPNTAAEQAACAQADDHVCLVVQNKGKFGCYLVENNSTEHSTANNHHDSDDATDDDAAAEEPSQQHTLAPLPSAIAERLVPHAQLQQISNSLVLEQLSTRHDEATNKKHTVVLMCGKSGSTLVLTRIPLRFYVGSTKVKTSLRTIGAMQVTNVKDATHVVTAQRKSSPAQIVAWLLQLQFVTPAYIQALAARTHAAEPLPDPQQYQPLPDNHEFWYQEQQATAAAQVWKHWTFVSIGDDYDAECLARAAGATVVELHGSAADEHVAHAKTFVSQPNVFGVNGKKAIYKKIKSLPLLLLEKTKMVKLIVAGQLPDGSDAPVIHNDNSMETTSRAEKLSEIPPPVEYALVEPHAPSTRSTRATLLEPVDRKRAAQDERSATKPTENLPVKRTKHNKETYHAEYDSQVPVEKVATAPALSKPRKEAVQSREIAPLNPSKITILQTTHKDDSGSAERKSLETADGGWLVAAPKQRQAFLRTRAEILDRSGDQELAEPAVTAKCSGLVVGIQSNQRTRRTFSGTDFKRFQKNRVPPAPVASVQLRAVLPKETQYDGNFESQRAELEEQQRRADALFRDETNGSRRRR